MFSYENGVILSALLYVYYLLNLLVSINSQLERNLNKVGERLGWLTLTIKPMRESDVKRTTVGSVGKFIFIVIWQGIFIFLSWVNVFIYIATVAYRISKDSGAPKEVKEFRWKLRNRDMTFDEIISETMKVKGIDESKFEEVKEEMVTGLRDMGLLNEKT